MLSARAHEAAAPGTWYEVRFDDGAYIVREREDADAFFLIKEGTVAVTSASGTDGKEHELRRLGIFDERA